MTKDKIKKLVIALVLSLTIGFCGTAEETHAKGAEISSQGAIVYRDDGEKAEIYAADFLLLKEKLDTISDEIFSPSYYAHVHQWEYKDMNDRTHTKHCAECGDTYDLTNAHQAVREEDCTIISEGKEYPGRRYSCECGRQWVQEAAHALVFELVDEICHRSRCILEEEGYCQGYEPVLEEHYAYYYIPDPDGAHHRKNCFDCAYQVEEVCDFTLDSWDEEIEPDASVRYCECGNSRHTEEGEMTEPEPTEPETDESENSEENPEGSVSENSISENTIIIEEEVKDTI